MLFDIQAPQKSGDFQGQLTMSLNSYSKKVKAALLDQMLELATFFTKANQGILLLNIPHFEIKSGLQLTTANSEVTAGF
jgi:hypothetical protein